MPLNYRSGFNRLLVVAWAGWAVFCLVFCFVYTSENRSDLNAKYDQLIEECRTDLTQSPESIVPRADNSGASSQTALSDDQTIEKLRALAPDQQKAFLATLDAETKQRILAKLKKPDAPTLDVTVPTAAQWKTYDAQTRQSWLAKMTPDQKAALRQSLGLPAPMSAQTAPSETCIDRNLKERQAALAPYSYLYASLELLIAIVVLPLLTYAIVIGLVRTGKWIRDGFTKD